MQKSRWLKQTLILSISLNALLIGIFFYFIIRDNPLRFSYQPSGYVCIEPPAVNHTFLTRLNAFSFEHLTELLNDDRVVDQGYHVRDFALGALATFYDFDVERALSRQGLNKKKWEFDETSFLLFPGLSEKDFEKIQAFALSERWPLTLKGFFECIERSGIEKSDPELLNYFCHTPEFVIVETLIARTHLPIHKGALLALVIEGGWERFFRFIQTQQKRCDFSDRARQTFLLEYIKGGAKNAAYLLLITDPHFTTKQLSDSQVEKLLDLLDVKTKEALCFSQQVVSSPRGDRVREKAKCRLDEYMGNISEDVVGRFYEKPGLKELRPQFRQQPPAAPDPRTHIIQPGESLWLIAKKYGISLEEIMQVNHLQSTVIQPGKTLKIPPPSP